MTNTIRMIVTDLDGTLLRTDKTISEYTKATLERCREAGIKTVYATARGVSAGRLVPSALFDGSIQKNGALAYVGGDRVYSRLIPYETARPLLLACDRHGLKTSSELDGMHYANFDESAMEPGHTGYEIVDFAKHEKDAEKLSVFVRVPQDISFVQACVPETLYMKVSGEMMMVMHREATKSAALAQLARIWGIPAASIVAFGDEPNDTDMLAYAGMGVAMENALDEVKAVANGICPNNDADGVAKWIEKNLL